MKINPTIFREYDIRGIAGANFSEKAVAEYEKWYGKFPGVTISLEAAEAIGRAYGTVIRRGGGKKIVIGHEVRPGADELTQAFVSGVRRTGCAVVDLGISLTPVVYFTIAHGDFDGGVNVTGSHNVYFYNGFKLMKKNVAPLFGQELQEMRAMIEREDFMNDDEGAYTTLGGFEAYKEYFLKHITPGRHFRVVIDCGNGSAGIFAPDLFRSIGCEVIELYSEPDATFPHHTPDPQMPQYMRDLAEKVKESGADLGIGFDADADRAGFVSAQGMFVDADSILLLFAKDVLSRFPGKKILYTVKSSQLFEELIPQYGGVPLMHRNGHAPIKETLQKDSDIIFAGEDTAHFFFVEDYFKFDDGLFAAGRLLELLSRKNATLSALVSEIPRRVRTPEIKLPCGDEEKFQVVERIVQILAPRYPSITLDGVRIKVSATGWGLVRVSNTSPYISLRVEGADEEEVIRIKNILADELEKYPEITDRLNRSKAATLTGKLGWV